MNGSIQSCEPNNPFKHPAGLEDKLKLLQEVKEGIDIVYVDYPRFLGLWLEPLISTFRNTTAQQEANVEHKIRKEVRPRCLLLPAVLLLVARHAVSI
jgi:hypothetical protein